MIDTPQQLMVDSGSDVLLLLVEGAPPVPRVDIHSFVL